LEALVPAQFVYVLCSRNTEILEETLRLKANPGSDRDRSLEPIFLPNLGMVIASDAMRALMLLVDRVARSVASVLITGESGTGKELIARAIHERSARAKNAFVEINCAALPEHLVESELFGYERGAFSGADQAKQGMFELANKGTLFLDEVGEIDGKIQAKLLRVLDGSTYFRLGGKQKISTDVRIISATNRPLDGSNAGGRFRADLFYRLSQFQLHVPPLRERVTDIIPIAENYLASLSQGSSLSDEVKQILLAYPWPGNVRELRNVIVQAFTVAEPGLIRKEHLPPSLPVANGFISLIAKHNPSSPVDLEKLEREAIQQALASTGGHQGRAAEQLGISRRTLSRKLQQYRLEAASEEGPLGLLSNEQQNCFRADAALPVLVKTAAGERQTTSTNLSRGGLGLEGFDSSICGHDNVIQLTISLPNQRLVNAKGLVIWSGKDGKVGVKFLNLDPESEQHLAGWIATKITEEGWRPTSDSVSA
jgi:DNA-binding NtrC family response regulator